MRGSLRRFCLIASALLPFSAWAGTAVPFTINLSKAVNVVTSGGTPRIAVDVAGTTRYANYTSGSGTSALVFTYQMQAGDVDLDGVAVSSPVQLNGGTIKDLSGNPLTNLTFTPPNTAGVKVNYPSLGMDFTNGAGGRYTLNGTPYTTLASFLTAAGGSFTRASVGTYFDSAGVLQTAASGAPRLDYDPVTHAAKGILIEEARTNLNLYSATLNNAYWSTAGNITVATDSSVSPDGSNAAEKFTEVANTATHRVSLNFNNGVPAAASTTYTVSAYFKKGSRQWHAISATDSTGNEQVRQWFDLDGGLLGTNATLGTKIARLNASMTSVGNGWFRCALTVTTAASFTGNLWSFYGLSSSDGVLSYLGDTSQYGYFWGAQLEQGAFATSYIPTTTAAVTRQGDRLSVPNGSWFNQTDGTWSSEFNLPYFTSTSGRIVAATSYAGTYLSITYPNTTTFRISSYDGNVATTSNAVNLGTTAKAVGAYDASNKYVVLNGGTVVSAARLATYPLTPSATSYFGSDVTSGQHYSGYLRKIKYYPARVPNAQLQLMTQ